MDASEHIDKYISELADWRGKMIDRLRKLIRKADPDIVEEWEQGTPLWSHNGPVLSVSTSDEHVSLNFIHGASLGDPHQLFNGGLDAKMSRTINFRKGGEVNEAAIQDLVRAAVTHNVTDL